jgi:hypothetical protein
MHGGKIEDPVIVIDQAKGATSDDEATLAKVVELIDLGIGRKAAPSFGEEAKTEDAVGAEASGEVA